MTPITTKGGTEQVPPAAQPGGNEKNEPSRSKAELILVSLKKIIVAGGLADWRIMVTTWHVEATGRYHCIVRASYGTCFTPPSPS